jgi:hypothetical protein
MRLAELAELMFAKPQLDLSNEESQGRQSGSLAWRLARAETKLGQGSTSPQKFVLKPTGLEQESLTVHLEYNISQDEYKRVSNGNEVIKGWSNASFQTENIFKKEETDWKMVYLARKGTYRVDFPFSVNAHPEFIIRIINNFGLLFE